MKNYNYSKNNKCKNCNKLIHNRAMRCNSCAMKKRLKNPKNHPMYKDGFTLKKHYCVDCHEELTGHSRVKRCNSCNGKLRIGKLSSRYVDGRTNSNHYCRSCGKKIAWVTWYYGKKRCKKCFQIGKLNPRYGKHWTKKQIEKRSKILHNHHIDCNHFNDREDNKVYLTQSGHMKAHGSLNRLVSSLIKRNIIYFDIKKGIYRLTRSK